jgi:hypothetical protein
MIRKVATLSTLGLIIATMLVPNARGQSCSGDSELNGAYALLGSRSVFASVPVTPPGTNGSTSAGSTGTPVVSSTPIGSLVGGVTGLPPFAVVGRVAADGAGNLFAAPSASSTPQQVGTYTVNPDCTISVTLNDVFVGISIAPPGTSGATGGNSGSSSGSGMSSSNSATTVAGSAAPTPASIKLEGLVLAQGAQIDLEQTGASDTSATVTMQKVFQFGGCTDATLAGVFGLVSQITSTVSPSSGTTGSTTGANVDNGSLTTTSFIGRLNADGAGMFTTDALAAQSPLLALQLTGTYTVNSDCSGTAQFAKSSGTTYGANFVIVQSLNGSVMAGPQRSGPELLFTFTSQTSSATTTIPGSGTPPNTGSGSTTGSGSATGNAPSSGISGSGFALHE